MGSKTLNEIITAVRDGEHPDYDDLRYTICAMDALATFDSMALRKLAEAELNGKAPFMTTSARWQYEEHFGRHKRAGNKPPKEYVGWNNDPDNPAFLARRATAIKVMTNIASRAMKEQDGD